MSVEELKQECLIILMWNKIIQSTKKKGNLRKYFFLKCFIQNNMHLFTLLFYCTIYSAFIGKIECVVLLPDLDQLIYLSDFSPP